MSSEAAMSPIATELETATQLTTAVRMTMLPS
jgi:hypothetical protein